MRWNVFASLTFAALSAAALPETVRAAEAEGDLPPVHVALPKIPSRAALVKAGVTEDKAIQGYVDSLMDGKNRKAQQELEVIKKQFQEEEAKRLAEEKERLRREDNYRRSVGEPITNRKKLDDLQAGARVKLDFQVPEVETATLAADVSAARKKLADEAVAYLSRLDADGDGKIAGDEYVKAGAILSALEKLAAPLDSNNDGLLSEEELLAAQNLPANIGTALRKGRTVSEAKDYRAKPFDGNDDSVLDVVEHKALVTSFLDRSLDQQAHENFYRAMTAALNQARASAAARYAELQVSP